MRGNVTNLTLKRNHFYHCSVMDVFITGSNVANGGFVENNVFEKPWENTGVISNTAYAFHFRTGGSPSPIRSNCVSRSQGHRRAAQHQHGREPGRGRRHARDGNLFLSGSPCGHANTTYSHNAFVSGGCGSSTFVNTVATYLAGFVSTADPGNYGLLANSVLRDRGNPANYPSQDKTGATRYAGVAPDIGAYEGT